MDSQECTDIILNKNVIFDIWNTKNKQKKRRNFLICSKNYLRLEPMILKSF